MLPAMETSTLGVPYLAPLITFPAFLYQERANAGGLKHPCLNYKRPSLHRKCSSLQLGASSTGGLLSELAEQGIGAKVDGGALSDSGPSGEIFLLTTSSDGPARVSEN